MRIIRAAGMILLTAAQRAYLDSKIAGLLANDPTAQRQLRQGCG